MIFREVMIKDMLNNIQSEYPDSLENCLSENLLPNLRTRNYTPVMKRPTCDSLEDKIKHFTKRKRIELKDGS